MTRDYATEVAQTILQQLGGAPLIRSTFGAQTAFVAVDGPQPGLELARITTGRGDVSALRILLEPSDTYQVQLLGAAATPSGRPVLYDSEGIYCDMLGEVISRATGTTLNQPAVEMGGFTPGGF